MSENAVTRMPQSAAFDLPKAGSHAGRERFSITCVKPCIKTTFRIFRKMPTRDHLVRYPTLISAEQQFRRQRRFDARPVLAGFRWRGPRARADVRAQFPVLFGKPLRSALIFG